VINILKQINTEITGLKPLILEPDGPQGAKLTLGITGKRQFNELKKRVSESKIGFSLENILEQAKKLKIPVIDS